MNKLTLFQTQKDLEISTEIDTFFNNKMYKREFAKDYDEYGDYERWSVFTDTVGWQKVRQPKTLEILHRALGEFLQQGAINE